MKKAFVLGGLFVTLLSAALIGGCPPPADNGGDDNVTDTGNGGGEDTTPDLVAGESVYNSRCSACHALGTFDESGAVNLGGKSGSFAAKLAAGHVGITLTATELANLEAFAAQY